MTFVHQSYKFLTILPYRNSQVERLKLNRKGVFHCSINNRKRMNIPIRCLTQNPDEGKILNVERQVIDTFYINKCNAAIYQ